LLGKKKMRYIIYIVIVISVTLLILSGYLSFVSSLNEIGPVIEQFSAAFGKLIGGLIMMISGFSLIGILIHYYILKRRSN
jgi:TRAP-type mannitol/chloroaromatic compound transport system permease small subunit